MNKYFIFLFLIIQFLIDSGFAQIRNDILILGSHGGAQINTIQISKIDDTQVKLFSLENRDYQDLTTGDYDGDGISEIAVLSERAGNRKIDRITVLNIDGTVFADFNAGERVPQLAQINNITSADLNDDGIDEIVVSCSETGDSSGKFNNLAAFSGSGLSLFSKFDYPGGYTFEGITGGNFDPARDGDEIITYVDFREYDRISIYSQNLSRGDLYAYARQSDIKNYKLSAISGGDIDGDGIDELITLSNNKIVIFKNKDFLKEMDQIGSSLIDMTCFDLNNDGIENIAVYKSDNFSSIQAGDKIVVFNSYLDKSVLKQYEYPHFGSKNFVIASGTFEQQHPLLFIKKSQIQQLDKSHFFYTDKIIKTKNFDFIKIAEKIRPWYTCHSADRDLHFKFAQSLKYAGILYHLGEADPIIEDCIRAFDLYALKYEEAYHDVENTYPRQDGVVIKNLLHECSWLMDVCWAYDLLSERMPKAVKINIRNKLLRLAAKRQIGYAPGRNNHANAHNLAIAAVGFLIQDKKLLGMAFNGTDMSNDMHQKRKWRGFYEQLQNSDQNDPVLFDYVDFKGKKPAYSDIGIYLPDYTLYEGSISYAYYDIGHLTRIAAIADHNDFHHINEYYLTVDKLARSFISTIFPFQEADKETNINFPAVNDDILQGLKTVPYLEFLHSKFYHSSPSPYARILARNTNTFENFITSTGDYTNQNDSLINRSQNLEHAGLAILRSSQDITVPKKLMVMMDYGPYGGNNHGHSDRFNFIVYSNYDEEYKQLIGDIGNLRTKGSAKLGYYNKLHNRYVRSTLSHNTILINNNRQADPNREIKTKCQADLSLYRDEENKSLEFAFANKKCPEMSFDSDNSDSLQYIYAKSGYHSSYGSDYSVDRTIAMIADKYIIDIVNIDKNPQTTLKYIDWIIRGPTSHIHTDQVMSIAQGWDWERSNYEVSVPNESYDYLFQIDTTKVVDVNIWKTQWFKSASRTDTLLQIYGINTGEQRIITALSPDSSKVYKFNQREIKGNLITRKYSISNDWNPEFLSVIRPAGSTSLVDIAIEDSMMVLTNKDQKVYRFDYKNLVLRE